MDFVLRAAAMYFLALIMVRLLGKRALGELGPFDFVVMTGVGHTVVSIALDKAVPFYEGIIILATLAVLEYAMSFAALKNQKLSNLITGKPVILIDNGRIIKKNLAREKFNVDDLLQELRRQGIRDIDEVDKGILESCGGFSVILKEEDEPVSRRDLGVSPVKRSEILTIGDITRADFFANQRQESRQEPGIMLVDRLQTIEKTMQALLTKLDSLEKRLE
ncbi:DUF421 domain-containing protein [Syntrophomonas palmitatica]|uniref:DUF421 domain-containing protein n=1 Tax=Syntrophomonas palmitatica TaxID=402877 RepID=UPI0006D1A9C0|nr:DUF421 domain-containing protein [Syntrophomonas palmitatica]